MRDVARNALVPWKDQQNFSPFTEGVVPNTDNYKLALRFYADKAEFPIMPSYTANQFDKAEAQAAGRGGTNNFSNINSTLQAQLYAKALRDYPSDYITPDMYRNLLEWVSWNEYVNGDNRYPDNNEYFFNWNPATQTLGRSGIHHNILGAYNFMIIDDIAGLRPRLDGAVELWPIDVGYDHYLIDNLSYHGSDLRSCGTSRATASATTARRPRACRCTSTAGARSPSTTSRTCAGAPRAAPSACSTAATRVAVLDQRARSPTPSDAACPTTPASSTCSRRPAPT